MFNNTLSFISIFLISAPAAECGGGGGGGGGGGLPLEKTKIKKKEEEEKKRKKRNFLCLSSKYLQMCFTDL